MPPQLAAERALGLLDVILANLSSTASSQQAANLKARSQLAQPNGSKKKGSEGLDQAIPNKQPEKSAGKKKNPTSPAAPAAINIKMIEITIP